MYIGVDLVQVSRWEKMRKAYPHRLARIFTKEEIAHAERKEKHIYETYAGLWAAKEACGKALGVGISMKMLKDVHLTWTDQGAPELDFDGKMKEIIRKKKINHTAISLSHDGGMAVAFVVMEAEK